MKLLWLDDKRNPHEKDWLKFSPIEQPYEVIWVKNYNEFVRWITENGLPDGICFDHDLSDIHIKKSTYKEYRKYKVLHDFASFNKFQEIFYIIHHNTPSL